MFWPSVVTLLVLASLPYTRQQAPRSSSTYLQEMVDMLRRNYVLEVPKWQKHLDIPKLSLTKQELSALYEAAVAKGQMLQLGPDSHTFLHEIDSEDDLETDNSSGYYYYYYPLKSIVDTDKGNRVKPDDQKYGQHRPPFTLTHHQHHINIAPLKAHIDLETKKTKMEPLFMAISGFIGMAVMFIFSVLFLPKFKGKRATLMKTAPDEMLSLYTVIMEAIEGRDCQERLMCEVGRTARALQLHNNRFTRMLQRYTPKYVSKKIEKFRKIAAKSQKNSCRAINCKAKR